MRRLSAAVFTAALIVGGGSSIASVGCALSGPAEVTPSVDPSIPGLDAGGYTPLPGTGPSTSTDAGNDGSSEQRLDTDGGADTSSPQPVTAPKPSAGEVLITEVMFTTNGPEPASEWIELHSLAPSERSLAGLILKDGGGRTHVVMGPLTLAPGAWVVLVRSIAGASAALVPAETIVYEYGGGLADNSGVLLANGTTGGVSLLSGANVIAAAPYGGWYAQLNSSLQLKVLDGAQSSLKASWCLSANAWTVSSGKGTPGSPNDCP